MTEPANLQTTTALASWIRTLALTLQARGVDPLPLMSKAGLDAQSLKDPNARYPLTGTSRLWQLAIEASGDEALGLDVARRVNQTTFHALGYSLLASPTLADAFGRLLRYFRIVSDAAELAWVETAEDYRFELQPLPTSPQPHPAAIDAFLLVIVRLCRGIYGPDFRTSAVAFCRSQPAQPELYERQFRAPLIFGAATNSITISKSLGDHPLPFANPELARHNDDIISRYLERIGQSSISDKVRSAVIARLQDGEPSQDAIADQLHLSLRSLQRKLADEGSSYKSILNSTREELARRYLEDPQYSVSEIAFMLGFGDSSSFTRAFKRWTGESPAQARGD